MYLAVLALLASVGVSADSHSKARSALACDPVNGGCYQQVGLKDRDMILGIALPPKTNPNTPVTEFIGWTTVALKDYGYAAFSLNQEDDTAFLIWIGKPPPCYERILSTRKIHSGGRTVPIKGQTVTFLSGTRQNETHLTTFFRCENCIDPTIVDVDLLTRFSPISLIVSSVIPNPIWDTDAPLTFRKEDKTEVMMDFSEARFDDYFSRLQPYENDCCRPPPRPAHCGGYGGGDGGGSGGGGDDDDGQGWATSLYHSDEAKPTTSHLHEL